MQTNLGIPGEEAGPGTLPVPRFKIAISETTEYWIEDIRNKGGRLWDVYLYDENRYVYLCELAPSYECHYLYTITKNQVDDETDEEIQRQASRDWVDYYRAFGFQAEYDCGNDGWSLADYDSYDELVEAAREYYICNHVV